jgi:hypothetical protein
MVAMYLSYACKNQNGTKVQRFVYQTQRKRRLFVEHCNAVVKTLHGVF